VSTQAPLILGVSGLRGIVGESLTPDVAARFACAFGTWLGERVSDEHGPSVVIGRDGRTGGADIAQAAIEGLLRAGCRVTDIGVAMTPTVGVTVDHIAAHAGMVVTASHNPQQWNGLKCLLSSAPEIREGHASASAPGATLAQEIIARFEQGAASHAPPGSLTDWPDASRQHVDRVDRAIDDARLRSSPVRFRVVLDSVNASGAGPGRHLLANLGCDVVPVNDDDSGVFPHPPEPVAAHLADLCALVREAGADIGFAQDPDADRLAIVDEKGTYIGEEYTLALAAESLLSAMDNDAGDQTLCANLSTSRMIDDFAATHGARVIRTPVGEANVVEAMKANDAVLGGEGNGGVIWPRVTCVRDSLSAMALVLSLMARSGKTVSELVTDINALCGNPSGYAIEKRKVDIPSREAANPAVEAVATHFASHPGARLDRQDGIRVDLDREKAWLHVRASNTEPIMRLIAEATSPGRATALLDEAQDAIHT